MTDFSTPIIFTGHWEPLIFRRRRGGQRTDEAECYAREHSDDAIRAMKDAGVNLVMTHFDKGFGLDSHPEDLPLLRDWVARLHANDLRVGAYIRYDTLVTETLPQPPNGRPAPRLAIRPSSSGKAIAARPVPPISNTWRTSSRFFRPPSTICRWI